MDVGRNQAIAQKFRLQVNSMSQQLPTIALMKDGECVEIRPEVTSNGKLRKFHFAEGLVHYKKDNSIINFFFV